MNDIQKKIINIYNVYKKICDDNDLKYYAIGGTCIGAIRHEGFIPWDDDIDVVMPVNDYIKFRKIANSELNSNIRLLDYLNSRTTRSFLKLHDINTTYIEKKEKKHKNEYKGIFIDIMPFAGCPKKQEDKKKYRKKINFYGRLHFYRNSYFPIYEGIKVKLLWLFLHPILMIIKSDFFIKKWELLLTMYPICDDNDIIFPWRREERAFFNFSWFSDCLEVKFENSKINIPVGYDKYLKKDFGNYMKIPPVEEQTSIHDIEKIDLNLSYKNYSFKEKQL